jgi:hypothetical protein
MPRIVRRRFLRPLLFMFLAPLLFGQDVSDAPAIKSTENSSNLVSVRSSSKKATVFANAALWGSTGFMAYSIKHGSDLCRAELQRINRLDRFGTNGGGGTLHPYKQTFVVTLPLASAISTFSFVRRKSRAASVWVPAASAVAITSAASMSYADGCH